ncbi:MAG: hypothetical protein QM765_46575 [Myxococcales bacterium]
MMHGKGAAAWAILAALLGAGCFHDGVPPDAKLVCAADEDCPPGLRCNVEVKRCIDREGDSKPPALDGLAAIAPAVAKQGQKLHISFRVSEDLFADPLVLVGERAAQVDEEGTARTERRYRFVLEPDGTEDQTAPVPVSVELVDVTGNKSGQVLAGNARFDFVAPALAGDPEVALVAPPHSLIDPVASAGVGATVSVTLTFDEAVADEPVVEAVWAEAADPAAPKPGEVLSFLRRSGGPTTFTFEHVLTAAEAAGPQGRFVLRAACRDAVGNERHPSSTAGFVVDTVPPQDPDVATEGRIVFRREPWGTQAGGGVRRMGVAGLAGAVGPGETVFVFTHDPHGELGRAVADDRGAVQVPLIYAELAKAWVQAVDEAGNASGELQVRDLEWVATMGGKTSDGDENPHQFVSRSWMGHGLLGRIGPGYGAYPQTGEALAREDFASGQGAPDAGGVPPTVVRQTGEPAWSLRDVTQWPPYRCTFGQIALGGSPVAFDLAHDQAVMVAGNGRTWLHHGQSWRQAMVLDPEGDGDPAPRCGAQLVYDERRGVVLMVLGLGENGEVWEWNGASWRRLAAGTGPSARSFPAVGYDRERGEIVVFGGSPLLAGFKNDTWVWNGKTWSERTFPPDATPPGRYAGAMAWDPNDKSLLMFGGRSSDGGADEYEIGDLWRWNGSGWSRVAQSAPWPAARSLPVMLEDTTRQKVLLFGGHQDGSVTADLAVWEWSGSAWSSRAVSPTPLDLRNPGAPAVEAGRANSGAWYDPFRRKVAIYGGFIEVLDPGGGDSDVSVEDQWEWDPTAPGWTSLTPPRDPVTLAPYAPPKRLMSGMVYDSQHQRMLLFGGASGLEQANYTFGEALKDLWTWDGVGWTQLPEKAPWPAGRGGFGMTYDPAKASVLLSGGWASMGDTWQLDTATGTWKLVGAGVQPFITVAMTSFDHGGALQTLRFGGLSLDLSGNLTRSSQTSVWNGAGWTVQSGLATMPSPRHMAAMAPDGQGHVVLFGGEAVGNVTPEPDPFKGARRNDTWEWDGAAWTCLQANTPTAVEPGRPEARLGHSLVFDPDRGRALLSDGWGAGPMVDYWDWDGAARQWTRRYPTNPDSGQLPTPAFGRAAAYDSQRKRFVFFGGQTATETCAEHWELDMGLGERPGHVFDISLAKSGIPADAAMKQIKVHAVAGGHGSGTVDGVELWGWLPQGWQTLAEEPAAALDEPASVDVQVDDARVPLLRFQNGLHFAIVPRGTNAQAPAEVLTDCIEATVRYQLP